MPASSTAVVLCETAFQQGNFLEKLRDPQESVFPKWSTRGSTHMPLLATLLLAAVYQDPLTVFFGNGCFFARQHTFVTKLEQELLGRAADELTAVAAYAGGGVPRSGRLCYENSNQTDEYGAHGAAEVVSLQLQPKHFAAAARVYFATFVELQPGVWARPDYQDMGAEYRALVGIPGGLKGPYGAALGAANVHNLTLVADAAGHRPDTLGTNQVFVMDIEAFPAIQAEVCLQFHDDALAKYPDSYHQLKETLVRGGRLHPSSCPKNLICG